MKTVFSLIYVKCCRGTNDFLEHMGGPFLFESEESAKAALVTFIINSISDSYPDSLTDALVNHDIDLSYYSLLEKSDNLNSDEAYSFLMSGKSKFKFEDLVSFYKNIINLQEDSYFGYTLEALPTKSFIEHLTQSDAIEVNGSFIRHYAMTDIEHMLDEEDVFLSCSAVDEDCHEANYLISLHEAQNATFNQQFNCWQVGEQNITCIKFS